MKMCSQSLSSTLEDLWRSRLFTIYFLGRSIDFCCSGCWHFQVFWILYALAKEERGNTFQLKWFLKAMTTGAKGLWEEVSAHHWILHVSFTELWLFWDIKKKTWWWTVDNSNPNFSTHMLFAKSSVLFLLTFFKKQGLFCEIRFLCVTLGVLELAL